MGEKLTSIKITKELINHFVNELKNRSDFQNNQTKSEHELLRGKLSDSIIIVYSSGSISYQANEEIDKIIAKYPVEEKKKIEVKPIRVHLTNKQLIALEEKLEQFADREEPKGMGEKATYRFENSNIILYHKGTIFSPKGHDKFMQSLFDVISEIPSYTDFDIMIGQDEVGKGEIFGPIVVSSVALNQAQIIKLQIEGIRDSKNVDSNDIERLANYIKKNSILWCTKYAGTDIFNEKYEEFKNESKTINDFLAWTHSIALEESLKRLDKKGIGNKRLLLIIDEFDRIKTDDRIAKKIKDRNIKVIQKPKAELSSVAVAAASIIAKNKRNKLLLNIEDEIGLKLTIENVNDILLHPQASKAMKLAYVRSAQRNGILPIPSTTIRGQDADNLLNDVLLRSDLESDILDFKEKFPDDASKIGKTISAFSNLKGGYLFFGISEEKEKKGVIKVQKIEERIQGMMPKFDPKPIFKFTKLVCVNSNEFLRVEVFRSNDEAVSFENKYYIREGSTLKSISPKEMQKLRNNQVN